MKTKELLQEISELPTEMRAKLADEILRTLNPTKPEIDQAWIKEVEQRIKSFEEGRSKTIPGEEVFQKAEEIIKQ
ncbi:putative addiction module component, TIGR02574 family [Fodinibius roseus]|uniref:Putative addiction module component, TIGR02574 family n=1 Tax=Fodinibius roseus TaxID=1194090 RepID=A0A1M5KQG9_9BACT|nr:addiction module protein [Fodinibius roseus]SHG54930.1 putative addiction module component, TIGR02574 family [Fodinibius roseus]